MINFFQDYIGRHAKDEMINIPLYDKAAWKRYTRGSCVKYKKYHDINMLCQYVVNIISGIPNCQIKYIRFVLIEGKSYTKWARSARLNAKLFSTHLEYIKALHNTTVDLLWQKYANSDVYNIGFLLIKDIGGVAPRETNYDLTDISDLLSVLINRRSNDGASLLTYPYILPLAYLPSAIEMIKKDARAFSSSFFKPQFTEITHQEVDEGEEWCDEGIMYIIPVKIALSTLSAKVNLKVFAGNRGELFNISEARTSLNTLLQGLNPHFEIADDEIIPLNALIKEMNAPAEDEESNDETV